MLHKGDRGIYEKVVIMGDNNVHLDNLLPTKCTVKNLGSHMTRKKKRLSTT